MAEIKEKEVYLVFTSNPSEAKVIFDGRELGTSPVTHKITVPIGKAATYVHTVVFTKEERPVGVLVTPPPWSPFPPEVKLSARCRFYLVCTPSGDVEAKSADCRNCEIKRQLGIPEAIYINIDCTLKPIEDAYPVCKQIYEHKGEIGVQKIFESVDEYLGFRRVKVPPTANEVFGLIDYHLGNGSAGDEKTGCNLSKIREAVRKMLG